MAPEQAAGDEVTAATDIYSAGMVLYEAATGKPWSIMHASQMDWSAVPGPLLRPLKKALEWEPEDRWANAADFRKAIVEAERRPRGRAAVISAVAAVVVTAAIVGALLLRPEEPGLDPNKIVVAPFENRTGDQALDHIGAMAMDWIVQGIYATGLVEVVSSTAALFAEKAAVSEAGVLPAVDRALGMAGATGAGIVITGSYYLERDSLQFHVQITDASQQELLSAPDPVSGSREAPRGTIVELQQRVMGALGAFYNPLLGERPAELAEPPQWDAYEEYARGLEKVTDWELRPAAIHFYRAAQLDTTFAAAKLWAVWMLYHTGQREQADSIRHSLEQSRDRLMRADREFLETLISYYVTGDVQDTYQAVNNRLAIAEDPVWLWWLAIASRRLNRIHEAIDAMERIDTQIFAGKGVEPSYWYYLAGDYHMLEDYERELSAARRGRQDHPRYGSLLKADIRALAALGRLEEMHRSIDDVFSVPLEGTGMVPPEVIEGLVGELRFHGHPQAAQEVAERGLAWWRSSPPEELAEQIERSVPVVNWNVAIWLWEAEEYGEARSIYEELVRENPDYLPWLGGLGILAARLGDREEALRIDEELRRRGSELRPSQSRGFTAWRVYIAAQLGERDRALALLRDVLDAGIWAISYHADWDLQPLWDDPAFQQLMAPKG
jgi:tetratricopeptide (TPR) repeat protein